MLETLARDYKNGTTDGSKAFGDRSHSSQSREDAIKALKNSNLEVTEERLKVILLPNTSEAIECYHWMKDYFNIAGDHMPNSKEIHLENTPLIRLFETYKRENVFLLSFSSWREIWKNLFPHVKMRMYKQVSFIFVCAY